MVNNSTKEVGFQAELYLSQGAALQAVCTGALGSKLTGDVQTRGGSHK